MQKVKLNNWKCRNKGFVFTLEAGIAIIIFGLLLLSLPQYQLRSMKELALTQQANDLLRVWSATGINENEMKKDLNEMLGNTAELWINERKIIFGQKQAESIATEGILLDDSLAETKVRIIVYYN